MIQETIALFEGKKVTLIDEDIIVRSILADCENECIEVCFDLDNSDGEKYLWCEVFFEFDGFELSEVTIANIDLTHGEKTQYIELNYELEKQIEKFIKNL